MRKFLALVLLVLPLQNASSVAVVIKDPSGLLNTIDTYLGFKTFDEAFMLEDKVWYQEKNCRVDRSQDGSYSASCEEPFVTEDVVIQKSNDEVQTVQGKRFTRLKFEQTNGNFLRYYFDRYSSNTSLSSFVVEIEKIAFEDVVVSSKVVKGVRAFYKINLCKTVESKEECFYLPQEILLGRNIPMLGQLLELVYHRETPENVKISVLQDFIRP